MIKLLISVLVIAIAGCASTSKVEIKKQISNDMNCSIEDTIVQRFSGSEHTLAKCQDISAIYNCNGCAFGRLNCRKTKRVDLHFDFSLASKNFNQEFPRTWPPKKINTLSPQQKLTLENMVLASSSRLSEMGVKHIQISTYVIKVLPGRSTYLNKQAKRLKEAKSNLVLDALYFAKNPFSAGTFDSKRKALIVSHVNLNDEAKMKLVLEHEFVHFETYKKLTTKTPSVFHCNFKGPQFAPHYLSCDEMNAYNKDIKTMIRSGAGSKDIKNKLQPANAHTSPIPKLIDSLNIKNISFENDLVTIHGKNKTGSYRIEFPIFNLKGDVNSKSALKHLDKIKRTAIDLKAELNKIKEAL